MQTANVFVALAGDTGNTVPKTGITVSEIAVLRSIHGEGAVFDIEPAEDIKRSHREERERLLGIYGKYIDGKDVSPVTGLFPGAAARLFETFDELELPDELFKAETRVKPKVADPLDHDGNGKKGGSKSRKKAAEPVADADDGVEDMADSVLA